MFCFVRVRLYGRGEVVVKRLLAVDSCQFWELPGADTVHVYIIASGETQRCRLSNVVSQRGRNHEHSLELLIFF